VSFRVVRVVVENEHVYLIVEADDKRTLSGGMRSVTIRIARSINAVLGRAGRFWADRWHGRELPSKRDLERALAEAVALGRAIEAGKGRR
jgi:REP element-mobilizing transposase RayT